jgi:glyoxylase-like metal-dependent hydrolase (beta-lactamase superfamily II)/rhodanese-related sulfurtransferase
VADVLTIQTPSLGDRSYLVSDGATALVVDPQRDIDRVLALAASRGIAVTHVFETHIHNDYVTGGLALARATGAAYHVNAADTVAFDRVPVTDGDVVPVGRSMRIRVIASPGHTFTHLAYALEDAASGQVVAVFTGGSLLHGSAGRPDLLGPAYAPELAAAQRRSIRRLAAELPDQAVVYPTHGFGSFCAAGPPAGPAGADGATIGDERRANPALRLNEGAYVAGLLAGLDDYPAYYAQMGPANAAGPSAAVLVPPAVSGVAELRRRLAAGEWVVDLRDRRAFAAGHLPGSLSFEYGDNLVANLGWLLPPGTPVTLIGESPGQVADAQRDLTRIGVDRIAGMAGRPHEWRGEAPHLGSYPVSDFEALAAIWRDQPIAVLDVRRRLEWSAGHIEGALHVPLHRLPGRLPDLPPGPIWVHCQAGYRASVAASLLDAAGRTVTAIDDDFGNAAEAGLPLTAVPSGAAAAA